MCGRARLASDYSEIKIRLRFDDCTCAELACFLEHSTDGRHAGRDILCGGEAHFRAHAVGAGPTLGEGSEGRLFDLNARAGSLASKPAFRDAWKEGRRCLVVTNGCYEWRKSDKQPFAIGMVDDDLMVMAGLWDEWVSPAGEHVKSCTVITTEPNHTVAGLHDRMPVILEERDWPKWLGEERATEAELTALLSPCASERLKIWPVGKRVGNVRNDSPEYI